MRSRVGSSAIVSEHNEIAKKKKKKRREVGGWEAKHEPDGLVGVLRGVKHGTAGEKWKPRTYLLCKAPTTVSLPTFGNIAVT